MTIAPGTDVTVEIPNARVAKYDPATDRYFVHSPAFYGGAWVDARDVTPLRTKVHVTLKNLTDHPPRGTDPGFPLCA